MSTTETPKQREFNVADVFPVPFPFPINGFESPWNTTMYKTPPKLATFVWSPELIKTMVLFWFSGDSSMKLIGHTGTGKTEAVMQFHSALNLPLLMVVANPQLGARDLIGGYFPTDKGIAWRDGPVTLAARNGLSILVDEYNVIDPGEATGLNALLEGRAFTIPETNETVVPQKGFRVFVTINPKSPGYVGRQKQDLANDERFVDAYTSYPTEEVENAAIKEYLKGFKSPQQNVENIADAIAKCAALIRKAFMGENDNADALPCTLSMRGSMRMAKWTVMYQKAYISGAPEAPIYMALDTVLANRQTPEVRKALRESLRMATGIDPAQVT